MDMAKSISLLPLGVNMNSSHSGKGTNRTMNIELGPDYHSMELATGEELGPFRSREAPVLKAQLNLSVVDPAAKPEETVGYLVYVPSFKTHEEETIDSSLCFYVSLKEQDFDFLWEGATRKVFPRSFRLEMNGLKYGYAPDGSVLEWDNTEKDTVDIVSMSWNMQLDLTTPDPDRSIEQ